VNKEGIAKVNRKQIEPFLTHLSIYMYRYKVHLINSYQVKLFKVFQVNCPHYLNL